MGTQLPTQTNLPAIGAKSPAPPPATKSSETVSESSREIAAQRADAPTSLNFASGQLAVPQVEFTPAQATAANNAWMMSTTAQLA